MLVFWQMILRRSFSLILHRSNRFLWYWGPTEHRFLPSYGGYYAIVEKDSNLFLEPVENKVDTWLPDAKYKTGDLVKWGGEYFRAKSDLDLGDDFSNLNWENVSKDSISNTFT